MRPTSHKAIASFHRQRTRRLNCGRPTSPPQLRTRRSGLGKECKAGLGAGHSLAKIEQRGELLGRHKERDGVRLAVDLNMTAGLMVVAGSMLAGFDVGGGELES